MKLGEVGRTKTSPLCQLRDHFLTDAGASESAWLLDGSATSTRSTSMAYASSIIWNRISGVGCAMAESGNSSRPAQGSWAGTMPPIANVENALVAMPCKAWVSAVSRPRAKTVRRTDPVDSSHANSSGEKTKF